MAVLLMLQCSKCPGFYSAAFCGMVRLGPRTCGVKIGGEMNVLLIIPTKFLNECTESWFFTMVVVLACGSLETSFSWRPREQAGFSHVPPLRVLCDRSVHRVTCWFILACMSRQPSEAVARNARILVSYGAWGWFPTWSAAMAAAVPHCAQVN